jgi:hypothetical protein
LFFRPLRISRINFLAAQNSVGFPALIKLFSYPGHRNNLANDHFWQSRGDKVR